MFLALDAIIDLGISSSLINGPEEIVDLQDDHLGLLALTAALCSLKPDYDEVDSVKPSIPVRTSCFQSQQLNLDLAFAANTQVDVDELTVLVIGPSGRTIPNAELQLTKRKTEKGAVLSVVPEDVGNYKVSIVCPSATNRCARFLSFHKF
jgi:hypothetical protein